MSVFDTAVAGIMVLAGFMLFCIIIVASTIVHDVYKITHETKKQPKRRNNANG
jgi:hypothetical protein